MKLYNIYRAILDGKRLFFVKRGNRWRFTFGSSRKQLHARYSKRWTIIGI